jgi:hypothetical protein
MSAHTPGPWEAIQGENHSSVIANGDGHYVICSTREPIEGARAREHLANARLIAAAPELLEVLERIAVEGVSASGLCLECRQIVVFGGRHATWCDIGIASALIARMEER